MAATARRSRRTAAAAVALAIAATLSLAPGAQAFGPPLIESTSVSGITDTGATLKASIDPNGAKADPARFEYVDQATFEASGFADALSAPVPDASIPATVKGKGDLAAGSTVVKNLTTSAGAFAPGQAITGPGIPVATTIASLGPNAETGALELVLSQPASETLAAAALAATGPQPLRAPIAGLEPATGYRFRVFAKNSQGSATGSESTFFTFAPAPTFGPCPNDAFRLGALAPLEHPSAALPDCRAYEQASPVNKNGADVVGDLNHVGAAAVGAAVMFGSTFGLPGATGAQDFPYALGSRGAGEAGWASRSLLPPQSAGEKALAPQGWLPDFSETFASAFKLGDPRTEAFYELHADGSAPTLVGPYVPAKGNIGNFFYNYAGASADAQTVVIEAPGQLPAKEGEPPIAEARPHGAPNVYAWDAASGRLHLASAMNSEADTKALLPKGAFAGPYNWDPVQQASILDTGGAVDRYYTQENRAVAADGSVFFTASGTGQLYERLNPTAEQSALDGQGNCIEPAKACTLHVSASHRNPPDPIGAAPAAFMAASADGRTAYFSSSEELTEDANTGPVVAEAAIGRAKIGASEAEAKEPGFLPTTHAIGVAISPDGEHIYWADPSKGTIGRARLDGSGALVPGGIEANFIVPGETSFETHPLPEPGVTHSAPSTPRFVAVDSKYVYWTNTGPLGELHEGGLNQNVPADGAGTIGRAEIAAPEDPDPEWITGASNPQGIAVNSEHVFWVNAASDSNKQGIAQAGIEGDGVNQRFVPRPLQATPSGLALSATHIYFSGNEESDNGGYLFRIPLEPAINEKPEGLFVGEARIRGIAIDGDHLFWASQSEQAIGRSLITEFEKGGCGIQPGCEKQFFPQDGTPLALATEGEHLYYSVNGETPPNPGADLYRFQANGAGSCAEPRGCLTDLTPDSADPNGAEVQGVVGASEDGSYLYFVANADLDGSTGKATSGDCHSPITAPKGHCNLYLLHAGQLSFIAKLSKAGALFQSDAANWAGSERENIHGGEFPRTALISRNGQTLIFRSREKLTDYDNQGVSEFYRYRDGQITCATCNPSGLAPSGAPTFATLGFPVFGPKEFAASTVPRFLSADGNRVFFETTEALVGSDTNGEGGCPRVGSQNHLVPACQDVYEWEAPGTGSCEVGGPGYSPNNQGCLYLISTGKSDEPSFFADASESGEDAFFFTREQLVGQDTDQLVDVYDARAGGGLAAQNRQIPPPCEGEASCRPAATPPPPYSAPPQFSGPPSPEPKRPRKGCAKAKAKGKKHCHKHGKKHKHRGKHHRQHGR
jgi:hypothetical protein